MKKKHECRSKNTGIGYVLLLFLIGSIVTTGNHDELTSEPSAFYRSGFLPGLTIPVTVFAGYRIVTDYLVTRFDRNTDRDPVTGFLYGAEPRTLGPDNASTAVLMVHGFVGAGNNFNDLPELLANRGMRVRVMSLPGHGTTPRDLEKISPDSLYSRILEELVSLRDTYGSVVMVGHSLGATLCALTAASEDIDGLVLGAPYFGVTYKWYYVLSPETWTRVSLPFIHWVYKGDSFLQVNRKEAKDTIVSYRWMPLQGLAMLYEIGSKALNDDIAAHITCPVLLIHSRADDAANWRRSQQFFENIRSGDKRAVWLERSNHHIFWDFEHDRVVEEIVSFIEELDDNR
ncbi:2-succinyl-6-hydroxy-2,4-cyclohexadiene-1-carboxylate synthase [subsurface metagenome]